MNPDENDGTPNRVFDVPVHVAAEQTTQDLRLTSSLAGRFNFVAGLYFAREQVDAATRFRAFLDLDLNMDGAIDARDCFDPLSIAFGRPPSPAGAATDALFGSLGFSLGGFATFGYYLSNSFEQGKTSYAIHFRRQLRADRCVNAAFRPALHRRRVGCERLQRALRQPQLHAAHRYDQWRLGRPAGHRTLASNADSEITGRLGIDYAFDNGNLLFASFSQGYRGGAYNGQAFNATHRSEQLTYANAPTTAKGYTMVNGRLTFAGDNWSASLWSNNLAEKEYFVLYYDLMESLESRVGSRVRRAPTASSSPTTSSHSMAAKTQGGFQWA